MKNKVASIFPSQDYPEDELMPVGWLETTWHNNRVRAWAFLQSEDNGLTQLERSLAPVVPQILLLLLAIFVFNLTFLEPEAWGLFFNNIFLNSGLIFLGLVIVASFRISRVAETAKNEADVNLFQLVDRWIKNRYGLEDLKFERNLIQILNNEQLTVNYLSEDYFLTTTEINGDTYLIVRNVHGEAPLKTS